MIKLQDQVAIQKLASINQEEMKKISKEQEFFKKPSIIPLTNTLEKSLTKDPIIRKPEIKSMGS